MFLRRSENDYIGFILRLHYVILHSLFARAWNSNFAVRECVKREKIVRECVNHNHYGGAPFIVEISVEKLTSVETPFQTNVNKISYKLTRK